MRTVSDHPGTVFRIDRFTVPIVAEEEFLGAVAATNTVLAGLAGCLQRHVLREAGVTGDPNYITIVEWSSAAALQRAREVMAARHRQMKLDPRELFDRLQIKAALGDYFPIAGFAAGPVAGAGD